MLRSKGVTSSKQEDYSKSKIKVLPMRDLPVSDSLSPLRSDHAWVLFYVLRCCNKMMGSFSKVSFDTLQRIQKKLLLCQICGERVNGVARFLVLHQRINYKALD